MKIYNQYIEQYKNGGEFQVVKKYLDKYWLFEEEYQSEWKNIFQDIFAARAFEGNVFKKQFNVKYKIITPVLSDEFLIPLRNCLEQIGDEEFVVIQDYDPQNPPMNGTGDSKTKTLPHRFKFPRTITNKEVRSGDPFTVIPFGFVWLDFYIFSKSGKWGCYYLGDTDFPIMIIGYDPNYENVFKSLYHESTDEKKLMLQSFPEAYKASDEFKKNWK